MKKGTLKKFYSKRCFDSWRLRVVNTTEAALRAYPKTGIIGFREGTVIKTIADSKMYVITNNQRLHIVDPDLWYNLQLDTKDVTICSMKEANLHKELEVGI